MNDALTLFPVKTGLEEYVDRIEAGFTTGFRKSGNNGSLAFQPHIEKEETLKNRRDFCRLLQLPEEGFRSVSQCHGTKVIPAEELAFNESREADALITDQSGLLLTVFLADCVPLLFFDPVRHAAAAVHGGWRGTADNIAVKTLKAMHQRYGTAAADLRVSIGPSIGACCYRVGSEVAEIFRSRFSFHSQILTSGAEESFLLDLRQCHRLSLMTEGVPEQQIEQSEICTFCGDSGLPSYRKEGKLSGRFSAYIVLR